MDAPNSNQRNKCKTLLIIFLQFNRIFRALLSLNNTVIRIKLMGYKMNLMGPWVTLEDTMVNHQFLKYLLQNSCKWKVSRVHHPYTGLRMWRPMRKQEEHLFELLERFHLSTMRATIQFCTVLISETNMPRTYLVYPLSYNSEFQIILHQQIN